MRQGGEKELLERMRKREEERVHKSVKLKHLFEEQVNLAARALMSTRRYSIQSSMKDEERISRADSSEKTMGVARTQSLDKADIKNKSRVLIKERTAHNESSLPLISEENNREIPLLKKPKKKIPKLKDLLTDLVLKENDPRMQRMINERELIKFSDTHKLLKLPAFVNNDLDDYKQNPYKRLEPRLYTSDPLTLENSYPNLNFDDLGYVLKLNNFPMIDASEESRLKGPKDPASLERHVKAMKASMPNLSHLTIDSLGKKADAKGKTNTVRNNFSVLARWYTSKMKILQSQNLELTTHVNLWSFVQRELIRLISAECDEKAEVILLLYLHCLEIVESKSNYFRKMLDLSHQKEESLSDQIKALKKELDDMQREARLAIENKKTKFTQTDPRITGDSNTALTHTGGKRTSKNRNLNQELSFKDQPQLEEVKSAFERNPEFSDFNNKAARSMMSEKEFLVKADSIDKSKSINYPEESSPIATPHNFHRVNQDYWRVSRSEVKEGSEPEEDISPT